MRCSNPWHWTRTVLIRRIRYPSARHRLLYCSRHTFATLQLEHDTDIYTIKGMLGHTNVKTTQIYAHIVDKSKRNAADAIHIDGLNKANAVSESA